VIYLLVAVLFLEAYAVWRIAGQLGGLRYVVLTPRRAWHSGHGIAEIGHHIRAIHGHQWDDLGQWRPVRYQIRGEAIVIVADVRSAAARRIARLLSSLSSIAPSPLPWSWLLAGSSEQAERLLKDMPLSGRLFAVKPKLARRAGAGGIPLAIYSDGAGLVRNLGFLPDSAALAAFVNGCPNSQFRHWAITANQEFGAANLRPAASEPPMEHANASRSA
jgi:hypothetical protein